MTRKIGNLLQHEQTMRHSCVDDGLVLPVNCRYALLVRLGWAEEEINQALVFFTFENFEGQDEVSSEASAFQQEEVDLAKPCLKWHVVNINSHCQGVGLHCIP